MDDPRMMRFRRWCPVYAAHLDRHPADEAWLRSEENGGAGFRFADFKGVWTREFAPAVEPHDEASLGRALRRFQRRMLLRIAWREVNALALVQDSLAELTWLAELVLQTLLHTQQRRWEERLGVPWDEARDRAARLSMLGLGKLGGGELNFCSDVDVIFFYDGAGCVRRHGQATPMDNGEFFARLCRDVCGKLQERDEHGCLHLVDLRLRPEGDSGPLLRSLAAMEHYYSVAGQTWERLALIKARPVAGDRRLGDELLETLNPFRFPRITPPMLRQNVASIKLRTEREVLGDDLLERDIKSGRGGIREIEFIVQTMQILHGGANPFLQTPSTLDALDKFTRYEVLPEEEIEFLRTAYLKLRRIENLLQARTETQTHALPADPETRETLATLLGASNPRAWEAGLTELRDGVRRYYEACFGEISNEQEVAELVAWFQTGRAGPVIHDRLQAWFGGNPDESLHALRRFAVVVPGQVVTRDTVQRFAQCGETFEKLRSSLAEPMRTLERIADVGANYGAPVQVFRLCSESGRAMSALCLLLDRSEFVSRLLMTHPELLDGIVGPGHRADKPVAQHRHEIRQLFRGVSDGEIAAKRLWLYVKAEQMRLTVRDILDHAGRPVIEEQLTRLAEAAIAETLGFLEEEDRLAVIALGRFGGGELGFGSDLDLLLLSSEDEADAPGRERARAILHLVGHPEPLERTYEVDLRLRPHGADGPLLVTLSALDEYHRHGAKYWERMTLTRARAVAGSEALVGAFARWRDGLIYGSPAPDAELEEIGRMRLRIEHEKGDAHHPWRSFKAGRGGLVDVEFLCQRFQLSHGWKHESLRGTNTTKMLRTLVERGLVKESDAIGLSSARDFLRTVEHALRRSANRGVSELRDDQLGPLAFWLELSDGDELLTRMTEAMSVIRRLAKKCIALDTFPA